jgi:hypothetical protein
MSPRRGYRNIPIFACAKKNAPFILKYMLYMGILKDM